MNRACQYKVVSVLRDWSTLPSQDDLKVTLECADREAYDIHTVARNTTYGRLSDIYQDPELSMTFVTMCLEGLHQGLEGWTDEDKMVIELFLADILIAVRAA